MKRKTDITKLRADIDSIDGRIVALLNKRYSAVEKIGQWKREHNEPIHVPEREKALLEKLAGLNAGPMTDAILVSVYRAIIKGSYLLEKGPSHACGTKSVKAKN